MKCRIFYIVDSDVSLCIKIFQGERELIKDNQFLGEFIINGVSKIRFDEDVSIEITFELDINNILIITAREIGSELKKELTVKYDNDRLTEHEIYRLVEEAEN